MRYRESVRGTQTSKPADIESNGDSVYARSGIVRVTTDSDGEQREEWQYEEAEMTRSEFSRLMALDASWVTEWSDAMRVAERRARYERMDPIVSSLRRKIDLGIDAESNRQKLMEVQTYLHAVHETVEQSTYPSEVVYPDEPADI